MRVLPPHFTTGTILAHRYRIDALAGMGGRGRVYASTDLSTGERVALKVLHHAGLTGLEMARFAREVDVIKELSHPGIVSYSGHGRTEDGQPFLVMAWVEGESLADRLLAAPLSPGATLRLVHDVAVALDEAHRHHIIHRDVKPSNILLRNRDVTNVVLVDFGLAKRIDTSGSSSGQTTGTPLYMAPEVAWGAGEIGPTADVFSLGCVAFECLTGSPPFSGVDLAATLTKLLFAETPAVRDVCPSIPEALDRFVSRMLEREPGERPTDARALLMELERLESNAPEE
jgi:serine/threonine protein kinase